jgi:GntR family transcriptional regulator
MTAEPMYRQIAEKLLSKIKSGEIERGGRLPTEIELMEDYNASRNTVRDAIKLLVTRRLVETRPGQGTYAIEEIQPFISTLTGDPQACGAEEEIYNTEARQSGRTPANSDPRVEIQKSDATIAQALQIQEGTDVVSRHQRRTLDGIPWSLQTSFYPMSLIERGATALIQARDIPDGTVPYLQNECRVRQVGYSDRISVRSPDETETAFFKLPSDGRVSVFVISRVAFEENGHPFRLMVTVYPADRNQFLVNVGRVPELTPRG